MARVQSIRVQTEATRIAGISRGRSVKVAHAREYGRNLYIFLYEKFFTGLYGNQFFGYASGS